MATPCHFLVLMVLLAVSHDSESKKPPSKTPNRIFPGRLHLNIDFHEECENVTGLAIRMNNSHIRTTPDNFIVMDGDYYCSRNIPYINKAVISFFNCPDRASGDCALFQTWRFGKEMCGLIKMKNQLWSPFFESITPRFTCPNNPPGKYELRNGTVDTRIAQTLPFPWEQYYWRLRYEVFDNSLFYCVTAGAQFLRRRA